MCVQSGTIVMQFANDTGEIEIQYQVAVPVTCRILPYVEVSKQGVEFILGSYIIVMLQHIQRQTFAETTRTDKEKITVGAFYQRDIHGLVHIIIIVLADIREVHHAVGKSLSAGYYVFQWVHLLSSCYFFYLIRPFLPLTTQR